MAPSSTTLAVAPTYLQTVDIFLTSSHNLGPTTILYGHWIAEHYQVVYPSLETTISISLWQFQDWYRALQPPPVPHCSGWLLYQRPLAGCPGNAGTNTFFVEMCDHLIISSTFSGQLVTDYHFQISTVLVSLDHCRAFVDHGMLYIFRLYQGPWKFIYAGSCLIAEHPSSIT